MGGIGTFATRDITIGDIVYSERPLVLMPIQVGAGMIGQIGAPVHLTQDQLMQAMLHEAEKYYELLMSRLLPEDREAFMALFNSHLSDGSGPITGIWRTNGLEAQGLQFGHDDGPASKYSAVGKDVSRINQSVPCYRA